MKYKVCITFIPKKDLQLFENYLKQRKWTDIIENKSCEQGCHDLMLAVNDILTKYTKNIQLNLPWFNTTIWDMMKKRDATLITFLESGLTTDQIIFTKKKEIKLPLRSERPKLLFFLEVIRNAQCNRIIWRTINKLIGKEKSKGEHIRWQYPQILMNIF